MSEPECLTVEDVEQLHREQLRLFGGLDGVRDRGALESAVASAAATFGGEFLHVGLFAMAAAYAFHIAENQPFVDGNKRTALNAALVFLGMHNWEVVDPEGLLYGAMMGISSGQVSKEQLAELLERLSVPWTDD